MVDINGQQVHVSVNIEGNTNSSYLAELGNIYGAEHVLVYQLSQKRFLRLSDIPIKPGQSLLRMGKELLESTPFFNNNSSPETNNSQVENTLFTRKELPPDTAAVHGFFTPSLFKGVLENPFISIILNNPLERMITLYEEWNDSRGEVDWRVSIPFDKKITFVNFAIQDIFINYQSRCLGNKRLGDYDLVGVAECQAGFIAQLKNKDWTGYIKQKPSQINLDRPKYKNLGITPDFLKKFEELNHMDYSIYLQAKDYMGLC